MKTPRREPTKREIRRAFGQDAVAMIFAHETGLRHHADGIKLLYSVIGAGFFQRMRWLLFGLPSNIVMPASPAPAQTDGQTETT